MDADMIRRLEERGHIITDEMAINEWLHLVFNPPLGKKFVNYMFPNDVAAQEYLSTIELQSEDQVKELLNNFLISSGSLGVDKGRMQWLVQCRGSEKQHFDFLMTLGYWRRLWDCFENELRPKGRRNSNEPPPWEGITWIVDLLPHHPRQALDALDAYITAHIQSLPDGRIHGLSDAADIIRAKFIGLFGQNNETGNYFSTLNNREFEHIIERLYKSMGYKTTLTAPSKDGGRDVIATKSTFGNKENIAIECKFYNKPVGVEYVRRLQGIVSVERFNKGVLATNSKFTRGSIASAQKDSRLELLQGTELVLLMNEYLGSEWHLRVGHLIQYSKAETENVKSD